MVNVTDVHQPIYVRNLLDNSLLAPEYLVRQAILSNTRNLLNDAYSRLVNLWALVLLMGIVLSSRPLGSAGQASGAAVSAESQNVSGNWRAWFGEEESKVLSTTTTSGLTLVKLWKLIIIRFSRKYPIYHLTFLSVGILILKSRSGVHLIDGKVTYVADSSEFD